MRGAITLAAAAGVVVVVSAGNDADEPNPSVDPNNPDPFSVGLRQAGNGNVIIAGSVNAAGTISAFANRAGAEQNWYLAALGERICCIYENGAIKITVQNGQQFVTVISGTSFSAPQISGAVALLRQAFPNLTAVQTVDLLLRTARDAGAPGIDTTYGRGIMDITRAFAPQGTASLASTLAPLPLGDSTGVTSPAMGDAVQNVSLSAIELDSYRRAYRVELGGRLRGAQVNPRLAPALIAPMRNISGGGGDVSLGFAVDGRRLGQSPWSGNLRLTGVDAERARVLAARVAARIAPGTNVAFGYAQGAGGLVAQVQGHGEPAFLVAGSITDDFGFARSGQTALALRHQLGAWGLTVSGEEGKAIAGAPAFFENSTLERKQRGGITRFGFAFDRRWQGLETSLAASWLREDRTLLGARMHDAFGRSGADSVFLDANMAWRLSRGLAARRGLAAGLHQGACRRSRRVRFAAGQQCLVGRSRAQRFLPAGRQPGAQGNPAAAGELGRPQARSARGLQLRHASGDQRVSAALAQPARPRGDVRAGLARPAVERRGSGQCVLPQGPRPLRQPARRQGRGFIWRRNLDTSP